MWNDGGAQGLKAHALKVGCDGDLASLNVPRSAGEREQRKEKGTKKEKKTESKKRKEKGKEKDTETAAQAGGGSSSMPCSSSGAPPCSPLPRKWERAMGWEFFRYERGDGDEDAEPQKTPGSRCIVTPEDSEDECVDPAEDADAEEDCSDCSDCSDSETEAGDETGSDEDSDEDDDDDKSEGTVEEKEEEKDNGKESQRPSSSSVLPAAFKPVTVVVPTMPIVRFEIGKGLVNQGV